MTINNYYYSGEFGYLNVMILPALEKYINDNINIENESLFILYTFPDYCYIINNLFSNKILCKEILLSKLRVGYNNIENEDYKQYIPLNDLFKLPNILEINCYNKISKHITTNFSKIDKNENYICYFPRFRDSGEICTDFLLRNSNNNECEYILNLFNKNNNKVYILGKETLDFNYSYFNIEKIENIEESIYYLNNCKLLISNDSGFIDFAKNCGCKKIIIIKPLVHYHINFNPFNAEQNIVYNLEDLEKYI